MALTDKLSAIGVAIREKTGKSELLTLDAMPTEIAAIETGGGGYEPPAEAFVLKGVCSNAFSRNHFNWILEEYGDRYTFDKNVYMISSMFDSSDELTKIPFSIDLSQYSGTSRVDIGDVFHGCSNLIEIPEIKLPLTYISDAGSLFEGCYNLRYAPNITNFKSNATNAALTRMFYGCYSLRELPTWIDGIYDKLSDTSTITGTYCIYSNLCQNCYSLDEISDLYVFHGIISANVLANTFKGCGRLKKLTFKTDENGNPLTAKWKSQTIDLSSYVGYLSAATYMNGSINNGITNADRVYNATEYETNKNNPNYWTISSVFSRYNHDSAVETINSLPDTSAYLATAGGSNTIKFKGDGGSSTDGGAINTLTEEEIAVATAKGWTVSLV